MGNLPTFLDVSDSDTILIECHDDVYNMPRDVIDVMSLILELVCSACAKGNCNFHESKRTVTDKVTGLIFEAKCVCENHGANKLEQT